MMYSLVSLLAKTDSLVSAKRCQEGLVHMGDNNLLNIVVVHT